MNRIVPLPARRGAPAPPDPHWRLFGVETGQDLGVSESEDEVDPGGSGEGGQPAPEGGRQRTDFGSRDRQTRRSGASANRPTPVRPGRALQAPPGRPRRPRRSSTTLLAEQRDTQDFVETQPEAGQGAEIGRNCSKLLDEGRRSVRQLDALQGPDRAAHGRPGLYRRGPRHGPEDDLGHAPRRSTPRTAGSS